MRAFLIRRWLPLILLIGSLLLLTLLGLTTLNKSNQPNPVTATPANSSVQGAITAQTKTVSLIGDTYLALGDSVAYGVGASPPEQLGYAGVFYRQYLKPLQPALIYKDLAIPGETTDTFISRAKSTSQLERALAQLDAAQKAGQRISPITLTIGGNDVIAARSADPTTKQATLAHFEANLKIILEQISAHADIGGKTDLILTTYYNPFADSSKPNKEEAAWVQRFNDTIRAHATQYKAKTADFFAPISGHEQELTWISQGDIHPNPAGHARLAAALWQATGYDPKG